MSFPPAHPILHHTCVQTHTQKLSLNYRDKSCYSKILFPGADRSKDESADKKMKDLRRKLMDVSHMGWSWHLSTVNTRLKEYALNPDLMENEFCSCHSSVLVRLFNHRCRSHSETQDRLCIFWINLDNAWLKPSSGMITNNPRVFLSCLAQSSHTEWLHFHKSQWWLFSDTIK